MGIARDQLDAFCAPRAHLLEEPFPGAARLRVDGWRPRMRLQPSASHPMAVTMAVEVTCPSLLHFT